MFNNSDYAVESSTRSASGNTLTQTIRMGQLVRGAGGACDTVQLSDWTHTHEFGRRLADPLALERAYVQGEERVGRRGKLRGLKSASLAARLGVEFRAQLRG